MNFKYGKKEMEYLKSRDRRMVYRHRKITRALFEKYRRRLSPCGSVASLYFWMVAGGAIPDLTDPACGLQK